MEYYLAVKLSKLGHEVFVVTFNEKKKNTRLILKEGFEVVTIQSLATVNSYHFLSLRGAKWLFNFLKMERPDVVHCQPLGSPLSLFITSWKKFFNYKIVGSIQTQLNVEPKQWNLKKKLFFSLFKIAVSQYAAKRSEITFAKNRELANLLSKVYNVPVDKFRKIPLGSDPVLYKFSSEARTRVRRELGFSESDVILVYSGKIAYSKGLDVLVNALKPIMKRNDNVKLLIIGKGSLVFTQRLKVLISKLEINSNVIFHPWVKSTELPFFYSASDIGVWPGLSSISIVDAASTGLPLIIARYPVELFAIENGNGFAFEIKNVEELRKYLELLINNDKLRKEMGRKSRALVEQKLNWEAIAKQYLNAYENALKL